jgi:hypothetical protein
MGVKLYYSLLGKTGEKLVPETIVKIAKSRRLI